LESFEQLGNHKIITARRPEIMVFMLIYFVKNIIISSEHNDTIGLPVTVCSYPQAGEKELYFFLITVFLLAGKCC